MYQFKQFEKDDELLKIGLLVGKFISKYSSRRWYFASETRQI